MGMNYADRAAVEAAGGQLLGAEDGIEAGELFDPANPVDQARQEELLSGTSGSDNDDDKDS